MVADIANVPIVSRGRENPADTHRQSGEASEA